MSCCPEATEEESEEELSGPGPADSGILKIYPWSLNRSTVSADKEDILEILTIFNSSNLLQ